jgi:serine/threonine-protein kinase SRPK3
MLPTTTSTNITTRSSSPTSEHSRASHASDTSGSSSASSRNSRNSSCGSGGSVSSTSSEESNETYYTARIGQSLHEGRYIIEKRLGRGYFSSVWAATDTAVPDHHPNKLVAIKISKSGESFQTAAMEEAKLLDTVGAHPHVIQLLNKFAVYDDTGKHICLVFEVMWKDLLYMVKRLRYKGFPRQMLKQVCYQVLVAVEQLHRHNILHTDLKPENFLMCLPFALNVQKLIEERKWYVQMAAEAERLRQLLRYVAEPEQASDHANLAKLNKNQKRRLKEQRDKAIRSLSSDIPLAQHIDQMQKRVRELDDTMKQLEKLPELDGRTALDPQMRMVVKVADLGNGCPTHKHYSDDVQTRHYRAPEVLLGCPYGKAIDVFSCGAMFYELATGQVLFHPRHQRSTALKNERHLSLITQILGVIPRHMIKQGKYARHYFTHACEFRHPRPIHPTPMTHLLKEHYKQLDDDTRLFADLLDRAMQIDPSKRWTISQCRQHPWFGSINGNGTVTAAPRAAVSDANSNANNVFQPLTSSESDTASILTHTNITSPTTSSLLTRPN